MVSDFPPHHEPTVLLLLAFLFLKTSLTQAREAVLWAPGVGHVNRFIQQSSLELLEQAASSMNVSLGALYNLTEAVTCTPRGTSLFATSTIMGESMAPWTTYGSDVQLVCLPTDATEVAYSIAWSIDHRVRLSAIGGGHGSWGYCYSNSLGISLDDMAGISLDQDNDTLTVGAGVRLGSVIELLTSKDYVAATGSCEEVGYVGWTMGGGFTPFAASIGLGVDNVLSFDVVLANGTYVTASADSNPDLFWALRGAGHQSFGIVIQMTTRVYALKSFALYSVVVPQFPTNESSRILAEWETLYTTNWTDVPLTTYEINTCQSMCAIPYSVAFTFVYMDDSETALQDLETVLQPFLDFIGPDNILNTTVEVLPFDGIVAPSGLGAPALEVWDPLFIAKEGLYIRNNLGASGWQDILDTIIDTGNALIENRSIEFRYKLEPYAGIAAQPDPSACFVHRNTMGDLTIEIFTPANSSNVQAQDDYALGLDWLDTMWEGALDGYLVTTTESSSFEAYQNYVYPRFGGGADRWPAILAYHGDNACRLVELKNAYDPNLVFDFDQGIPLVAPAGGCEGQKRR